jgi:hypothetical protein
MLQDRAKEQHKKNLVEGGKKSFEYFIEVGMLEIYNDEGKLFRYSRL